MNVQWYPGHMTKAKRMMQEDIKLIDLIMEIVDAREPLSSRNPDIDELAKGKSRLIILNKIDLADEYYTKKWEKYFTDLGFTVVLLNSRDRKGIAQINSAIESACKEKIERDKKRGILNRPIRTMVVGIPNVGKSTFINALCKRAATKTGDRPGVTKGKQWIKLNKKVELLDTPGILWPKFENEQIGKNLAYIGSINDEILNKEELACELISTLCSIKSGAIAERYKVDENKDAYTVLNEIGKVRGCLIKGGDINIEKAADILLDEFRGGKLGRITLEDIPDESKEKEKA